MFAEKLKELRFFKKLTQADFAKIIGVSQQTVASWENQRSFPNLEMLNNIADYFAVSADYLLGRNETDLGNILSDEQLDLLNTFNELDTINQQKVIGYMEGLCHEQKRMKKVKSLTSPNIFRRKQLIMKG